MTARLTSALIAALIAVATACSPASSTPAAQSDGPQVRSDADGSFRIEIGIPSQQFDPTQAISITTTLTYLGPGHVITVGSDWSPPVYYSLEQVNGTLDQSGDASRLMRERTDFVIGEPTSIPFWKGGGWSGKDPNAPFWERYFADKELHLPPGAWQVTAHFRGQNSDCRGPKHELDAGVNFVVN